MSAKNEPARFSVSPSGEAVDARASRAVPADLDRRFDLHRPKSGADGARCDAVRAAVKAAAVTVVEQTPPGREQASAVTKLEEALYWAIGAIVRP